jgi:hypothetical protein
MTRFLSFCRRFARWAVPDSNQRPPACKAGALPAELTARRDWMVSADAHGLDEERDVGRPDPRGDRRAAPPPGPGLVCNVATIGLLVIARPRPTFGEASSCSGRTS